MYYLAEFPGIERKESWYELQLYIKSRAARKPITNSTVFSALFYDDTDQQNYLPARTICEIDETAAQAVIRCHLSEELLACFPSTLSPRVHIRSCDLRGNTVSASYNGGGRRRRQFRRPPADRGHQLRQKRGEQDSQWGAIYSYQSEMFRVSGCRFVGNLFDSGREDDLLPNVFGGGAIVLNNSDLRMEDTTFEDNISVESQGGGAIYVVGNGGAYSTGSSFRNNVAVNSLDGGSLLRSRHKQSCYRIGNLPQQRC